MLVASKPYYPLLQELSYIRPLRMMSPAVFANGISSDPLTHNSCRASFGTNRVVPAQIGRADMPMCRSVRLSPAARFFVFF